MNVQSWTGYTDPRFGYGSMYHGFKNSAPNTVTFSEHGSVNVHMSVPDVCKGWLKGQHRVCFTMWETDTLPRSFVRWLSQYDQILVPCKQNVELFSQHHDNVQMVPLGVDWRYWKPQDKPDGPFRFHAGGSLWYRKGLDLVIEAFNKLKLPDAELHIKAAPHALDSPRKITGDNIYLNRQWLTLQEQRDWFYQADCYVAPARGEGWGLMPLQAISAGIPTIMSTTTGQTEFAHLATGLVSCSKSKAHTIGQWDEPNLDELAEQMLEHYQNSKKKQALANAQKVKEFSWAKATQKLLDAIPTGEMLATSTPVVAPNVTVQIQVSRKVNANIGKQLWTLHPGTSYTVPENVYQVLYDSGAVIK